MEERDLEMAEKMVDQERESSMAAVRRSLAAEYHEDFDGETCMDCPNPVGVERLKMNKIRCVHCQTIREQKIARGIYVEPNGFKPKERPVLPELVEKILVEASGSEKLPAIRSESPGAAGKVPKKRGPKPKAVSSD